ncbi:MAG: rhomboid family intramembrane serine protease [Muribaculaceae bacterium]|nr:rhomboid family intramembrane serine protease [Muribaculaceae bacterium]
MRKVIDFFAGACLTWIPVAVILAVYLLRPVLPALEAGGDYRLTALLTYGFVHTAPAHLAVNVVTLLLAGTWFERRYGGTAMLAVFMAGNVCGGLCFTIFTAVSAGIAWLEGASAGIIALAVCVITAGRTGVRIGSFRLSWQALSAIILCVSAAGVFGLNPGGAAAHIGGWLAGVIAAAFVSKSKKTCKETSGDIILDRVRVSGYASLTEGERAELFNHNHSERL